MLNADTLTFQEFAMREKVPLASIHEAVLEFLRGRNDAVVYGAQAVNAYVKEPRMTQDIDLVSTRAVELAEEIRQFLSDRFHIAVRVREVAKGKGFRLFQVKKSGNRHLVDVRPVDILPSAQRIAKVLVVSPPDLIASKVISYYRRRGKPKSGTDWRDIAMLLLAFPELKSESGPVAERLLSADAHSEVMNIWNVFVAQNIRATDDDDDEF
jgi:hypothetical protein